MRAALCRASELSRFAAVCGFGLWLLAGSSGQQQAPLSDFSVWLITMCGNHGGAITPPQQHQYAYAVATILSALRAAEYRRHGYALAVGYDALHDC